MRSPGPAPRFALQNPAPSPLTLRQNAHLLAVATPQLGRKEKPSPSQRHTPLALNKRRPELAPNFKPCSHVFGATPSPEQERRSMHSFVCTSRDARGTDLGGRFPSLSPHKILQLDLESPHAPPPALESIPRASSRPPSSLSAYQLDNVQLVAEMHGLSAAYSSPENRRRKPCLPPLANCFERRCPQRRAALRPPDAK
jgi:hypothetical protein